MATEKNPFGVLGFAPNAFHKLSDEDIRSLVRAQHRTLSMIHHHDRGGDPKRFKEVQEAFKKLEEDFEFDFWKKNFLRPRKNQVEELEKENDIAQTSANLFSRRLIDFWVAYCSEGVVLTWEDSLVSLGHDPGEMSGLRGFSIFNPPFVSCLMMEKVKAAKRKLLESKIGGKIAYSFPDGHGTMKNIDGTVRSMDATFELAILPDGSMVRQDLVKTHFDAHDSFRPQVRKELIQFNVQRPSKSYYWKPEGNPVKLKGKLLGSISPEDVANTIKFKEVSPAMAAIGSEVDLNEMTVAEEGYLLLQFEPYIRFVQPIIRSGDFLIIVERNTERDLRFKVIGYARKIYLTNS